MGKILRLIHARSKKKGCCMSRKANGRLKEDKWLKPDLFGDCVHQPKGWN
jgi:hypothetical protein